MTVHQELLKLIAGEWPERVPRMKQGGATFTLDEKDGQIIWWHTTLRPFHSDTCEACLELAAWRIVREWCKARKDTCIINDLTDTVEIWCGLDNRLACERTDADALLAALTTIKEAGR